MNNRFATDSFGNKFWYDQENSLQTPEICFYIDTKNIWVRPHREDGPAVIWPDGSEFYRVNGKIHRTDGPAFIRPQFDCGIIEWWLNHKRYYFDDWCKELNKTPEEINELKLKYNI